MFGDFKMHEQRQSSPICHEVIDESAGCTVLMTAGADHQCAGDSE